MSRNYDNYLNLTCETTIKEEKDGYYTFGNTVFYGEKGGMLGDQGLINGLEVVDLKWEEDTLWHKVDGVLVDPIQMIVDKETRLLNTTVQSAFHILDGYYRKLGLIIVAIGVNPDNQWYEVDSKELGEDHLEQVQQFMNDVLLQDIHTEFSYFKGSEYPNEKYQHLKEVREVKFGEIDKQPCGTPHVNHVSEIGNFTVLDSEKTSRGTRIYVTVSHVSTKRLSQYHQLLKDISKKMSTKLDNVLNEVDRLVELNKQNKKTIEDLNKQLNEYRVNDLANSSEKVLLNVVENSQLRNVAQMLLSKLSETKILIVAEENMNYVAIVSPNNQARELLTQLQQLAGVNGGGSPSLVSGKSNINVNELINVCKKILE